MWNQETDRMFLAMREDAVLIFVQDSMKLIYLNPSAAALFPQTDAETTYSDLFRSEQIDSLLTSAAATGRIFALTLDQQPWFEGSAVLHVVRTDWDGQSCFVITIDKRDYGPTPEAFQLMNTVLNSAYFTAVRIDLHSRRASIISDKKLLMNTQAHFPDFSAYFEQYANAVIHPEDREQFINAFTAEQLRLFLEANTSPACTVRRLTGEEYRWASFTLAAVNPFVVLLFGQDSNDQHLQQERSDRYRSELATVSKRNSYIISGVTDIFRLMLHIDLKTGEAVFCSLHPDLEPFFSYDKSYQYNALAEQLMQMVHPDDREALRNISSLQQIPVLVERQEYKVSIEYRRIAPQQDPNVNAKWTRSVFTLTAFEGDVPTEAIYAVQDIDTQKQKELEAKQRQASITEQFYTLIRNRYLWLIEHDYSKRVSCCQRIANHMVLTPMECPYGQFFERMIMPHCHPEDYKKVALALMPLTAEEEYKQGKRQISVDYRHKTDSGWRYARAEMFLQENEQGVLHALIYISDIDEEVRQRDLRINAEHEQFEIQRKIGRILEGTYLRISEIDLDADRIRHFRIENNRLITETESMHCQEYCDCYPEQFIHPDQRREFRQIFRMEDIRRASREHQPKFRHMFLADPRQTGEYVWCNIGMHFLTDENGRNYAMAYVEDINGDVEKKDADILRLKTEKEQLLEQMRQHERARIRRAHVFLNIASSFQLALNQIYGALDSTERSLPESDRNHEELSTIFTAYERLSAMTVCAKDLLLLDNNQLPLLKEQISLRMILQRMRSASEAVFTEKQLKLVSFVTNVKEEVVLCDSQRLSFLLDNIFINVIRSLPNGAELTLQLAEMPAQNTPEQAVYEFSLITHGDSISQDIQSGILCPIPKNDPMNAVEAAFFLHNPDYRQYNIYLSKRLIAAMGGKLEFLKLPDHAAAVTLRLPLTFVRKHTLFPLRRTFGKRALIWDSKQAASISTIELLRESGMQSDWQRDFDAVAAYLNLAAKQNTPYDLLVIRETDLCDAKKDCLHEIRQIIPDTPVFIIKNAYTETKAAYPEDPALYFLPTPVFRSTMAEQLWEVFGDGK